MFADTHLADVTRLMALGHPFPYIFLALPFLYILTLTPVRWTFRSLSNLLRSNKSLATPGNPRFDGHLLFEILAGTYVLLQSNMANMVYLSIGHALAHRPL